MTLLLCASLGYRLSQLYQQAPTTDAAPHISTNNSSFLALLCCVNLFACVLPITADLSAHVGHKALLTGILVAIVTVELFYGLQKLQWPRSKTSTSLDGSLLLQQAFKKVLPSMVCCVITVITVRGLQHGMSQMTAGVGLQDVLPSNPSVQSTYFMSIVLIAMTQALWWLGLHGGNLVEAYASSVLTAPHVLNASDGVSQAFLNGFAYIGGSGATGGLTVALLLASSERQHRKMGKVSLLPALFNVNETLVFGLPLVLNRIMLWPFLLAPMATHGWAWMAYELGILSLDGQATNWATPIVISGYAMSGNWSGIAVQIVGLMLSAAIYLPFVIRLDHDRQTRQQRALKEAIHELASPVQMHNTKQVLKRHDSVGEFARALHDDFQVDLGTTQVFQVYQPKHDCQGNITGLEALLRWHHRKHGFINPSAIINIAEECDLITKIGNWSLDAACRTLGQLRRQGFVDMKISVNLSPIQLEDQELAEQTRRTLERHGVQPDLLELELTEGRLISTSTASDNNLKSLRALGVHLSMDDFGMGCTSLLYMQRFDMSAIKIDGSLSREVMHNEVTRDIIRTIAALGERQGVAVIAEYVETEEQRRLLVALGCTEFQGYLYSKPLTLNELLDYIHQLEPFRR